MIKWWQNSFIDPQVPLDAAQRRLVQQAAARSWMSDRRHQIGYGVAITLAFGVQFLVPQLLGRFFGGHRWYYTLIGFAAYIAALGGIIWAIRTYHYAPCVYAELRRKGIDVCPACGDMMEGLGGSVDKCPECGAARVPLISDSAPRS